MSSSTSKVAQDLLAKTVQQAGLTDGLDGLLLGYVGDLFASWLSDGYGLEELQATLGPILASCGLDAAAHEAYIGSLDAAFGGVRDRRGMGPQITAVVPIETPVQMSLSPITTQMADEPKRVSLDWLSSRRVVASQVDRSKLVKAEAKLRAKAAVRRGLAEEEADRSAVPRGPAPSRLQTAEEVVDGLVAEWRETGAPGSGRGRRDVHCESFDISLAGRRILTGAALVLAQGRRYGLVGRNGIGKSTLLRHIASRQLDGLPPALTILHVEQEVRGDETPALQAVMGADVKRAALLAEERRLAPLAEGSSAHAERLQLVYRLLQDMDHADAEARACTILAGLGFAHGDMARATREFSGGWRMRLALAQALFCQPDLLLLDEPTNMLDFPAVVWLETHLRDWPGTLLVVSHDRLFLDATATDILLMYDEQLEAYRGDYAQFVATRGDRQRAQQREYDAQLLYRASLQAFVDRWRYNANRAPQAQSRLKILEKLPVLRPVVAEAPVVFRFPAVERLPAPLIQASAAAFAYGGEAALLLRDIDISLQLDSRLAIVGPNGAGKTTLLKLLVGQLEPTAGRVAINGRLRVGYFSQHFVDQLDLALNPLQALQARFPGRADEEYRAQLGAFGLSGPLGLQPIRTLSGGQKSRVVLAALALQQPQLMLLDEPTNHLDMDSIDALIAALKAYQGGVVVVSHDKRFIDALSAEIWVCKDGTLGRYEGSIHDYARSLVPGMGKLH